MHQKSQEFSLPSTITNQEEGRTLTEGRKFKILLKENYSVALDSCYLFNKKMLNMKLNMILIVLMEFAYIRHF